MRTKGERAADNAAHVRDAVQRAQNLSEARKLLRDAGFEIRSRAVRAAWEEKDSDEPGSLFDQV